MTKTPEPEINKDQVKDSSDRSYHLFPDSTSMGGVRSIKDPIAALSC